MFQTVRHWWTGGRGKVTLRLFAFEFVVVVAGVLVAQGLAGWVQSRTDYSRMERARRLMLADGADIPLVGRQLKMALPCLGARVDLLMRAAAEDRSVDPALLSAPRLVGSHVFAFEPGDMQRFWKRYGGRQAAAAETLSDAGTDLNADLDAISDEWLAFSRLDPRLGPVSAADRDAVRAGGARIKAAIGGALREANSFVELPGRLGINPDRTPTVRPVRDCEEMWRIGQSWVYIGPPTEGGG